LPPNRAEHGGASAGRLPVVLVTANPDSLTAASATAQLAGLTVVEGWSLADGAWDLSHDGLVVRGQLDDSALESEVVNVVVRGAGAIVGLEARRRGDARFIDALRRAAPLLDWRSCPFMRLDAEQIRLLHALARGCSARAAAREVHVSERTAHRRIADARTALNATSTNAAAAEVDGVVRSWQPTT
jgi:DNA-binding NarL/FixJ family response regulator